jgi:hypothetical protein
MMRILQREVRAGNGKEDSGWRGFGVRAEWARSAVWAFRRSWRGAGEGVYLVVY